MRKISAREAKKRAFVACFELACRESYEAFVNKFGRLGVGRGRVVSLACLPGVTVRSFHTENRLRGRLASTYVQPSITFRVEGGVVAHPWGYESFSTLSGAKKYAQSLFERINPIKTSEEDYLSWLEFAAVYSDYRYATGREL